MLNIIRLIENGLAAWWQDFSGVETPLLIKYVKTDKARKSFYVDDEKKATKRDDTVFCYSHYQRRKYSQNSNTLPPHFVKRLLFHLKW